LHRLLGRPPEHHGPLDPALLGQLPHSRGMSPKSTAFHPPEQCDGLYTPECVEGKFYELQA
jgi:hypothetical protein